MILVARQHLTRYNKNFDYAARFAGKEVVWASFAACVLQSIQSPHIIPLSGAIIGFSAIQLAYKVTGYYNLRFDAAETEYFQIFRKFPKLKIIILIFAFTVVGTYPYIGLALGAAVGFLIGIQSAKNQATDPDASWMKKIWLFLR